MPWMMVMPPPCSPATGVPPGSGAVPVAVPAAAMAFPASPAQAQAYAAQYHAAMVQRMAQVGGAARAARYRLCLGCGVWSSKALLALCMPGLRLLANAAATSTWSRQGLVLSRAAAAAAPAGRPAGGRAAVCACIRHASQPALPLSRQPPAVRRAAGDRHAHAGAARAVGAGDAAAGAAAAGEEGACCRPPEVVGRAAWLAAMLPKPGTVPDRISRPQKSAFTPT